jgi:TonB-linked SusC/RagA family outer membrane protein
MCSISICGYSRDLTFYESTSESSRNLTLFQSATISGKVLDEAGSGMPGVNVIVKGTSNGTTTDAEGAYRLNVTSEQTAGILVFSFIGYTPQEQPINNRSTINISMVSDISELTEVIVVGYGTQEKRDVTSSISSISGDAITKIPTGNAMDAMKGQIAGVDILSNGGRPGQPATITIRGRRSLTASNDPLFVIDGIPMISGLVSVPSATLTPADIASVEVLKDAASQAVYGSRGSNGVILITTKRGEPGVTSVNFSTSYGVSEPWKLIPMMNGEQFANLKREANRVGANGQSGRAAWGDVGSSIPADAAVFNDAVELNSVQNGLSTDWQDQIYQNGSQLNQQLSVSGGSDKTHIRLSFSNFQEDGLIEGTGFETVHRTRQRRS